MDKFDKQKIILTTRQILLFLVDAVIRGHDIFDARGYYWKTTNDYYKWRDFDKVRFQKSLYKLNKSKFIKTYKEGKEKYIQLTQKGKDRIKKEIISKMKIKVPKKWDYKWRMVVFDIPENKKKARDILAKKLKQLGFHPLQKSVFVFPFDCREEIERIKNLYEVGRHVQYIVAEQIETEENLLGIFFDQGKIFQKILPDNVDFQKK